MHVKIDVSMPKAFKQKYAYLLDKFTEAECLHGPELIRARGNAPDGTHTCMLADMFQWNIFVSRIVHPEHFRGRTNLLNYYYDNSDS